MTIRDCNNIATENNVGRKTPEEVKKWLDYCFGANPCADCLYDKRDFPHCVRRLLGDALVGYQHIESRLAQAEREKQALLHDMKHVAPVEICEACAHSKLESKCEENDFNCDKCPEDCPCKTCRDCRENFQWRGICADNTKEDHHAD